MIPENFSNYKFLKFDKNRSSLNMRWMAYTAWDSLIDILNSTEFLRIELDDINPHQLIRPEIEVIFGDEEDDTINDAASEFVQVDGNTINVKEASHITYFDTYIYTKDQSLTADALQSKVRVFMDSVYAIVCTNFDSRISNWMLRMYVRMLFIHEYLHFIYYIREVKRSRDSGTYNLEKLFHYYHEEEAIDENLNYIFKDKTEVEEQWVVRMCNYVLREMLFGVDNEGRLDTPQRIYILTYELLSINSKISLTSTDDEEALSEAMKIHKSIMSRVKKYKYKTDYSILFGEYQVMDTHQLGA